MKKMMTGLGLGIIAGVGAIKMVDKLKAKIVDNVMDDTIKIFELVQEMNEMKENKEDNNEENVEE